MDQCRLWRGALLPAIVRRARRILRCHFQGRLTVAETVTQLWVWVAPFTFSVRAQAAAPTAEGPCSAEAALDAIRSEMRDAAHTPSVMVIVIQRWLLCIRSALDRNAADTSSSSSSDDTSDDDDGDYGDPPVHCERDRRGVPLLDHPFRLRE